MASGAKVTFVGRPRPPEGGPGDGAAQSTQIRLAPHAYPDGGATLAGQDRPNPRAVSNAVFSQVDDRGALLDMPNPEGASGLLWIWGQFLDHDIVQTRTDPAAGRARMLAPADDPVFRPGTELSLTRSQPVAGTGDSRADPRQYANQVTGYIDGSNLYGSDADRLAALLTPGLPKLRLTDQGTIGFAADHPVFNNGAIAGDTRANENLGLLSMHALFAREHNRIVDELADDDPTLGRAALFEGARARVEAIIQAITYNEYLPILIGDRAIPAYDGFRPGVDASISLEFSTAVYRLGHTLLSPSLARMNEDGSTHARGNVALRDAFNTRGVLEETGVEAVLRGGAATRSQALDARMIEDVRSMLFGQGGPGSDLAAINIQRGRDHGLPTYNDMRAALGLERKPGFNAITGDDALAARLRAAYGDVSRLDLWVGGLAEDATRGGMVGETFRAVLVDQFTRLRDGDRFWSEDRGFGKAELNRLWSTTLSDVIERNTDVRTLQDDAMFAYRRLMGSGRGDTITGGAGRDLIAGFGGDDRLEGGANADQILGGADDDRLSGQAGADKLVGSAGADRLFGGPGSDALFGGTAADRLSGGDGHDRLIGGGGGDRLSGAAGADRLNGGQDDDRLFGGAGADRAAGGSGDDLIDGGQGADTLSGGRGDDVFRFVYAHPSGHDRITDFDRRGDDVLKLVGYSFGVADPDRLSVRQKLGIVEDATRSDGGDATIDLADLGGRGEIRLEDAGRLSFTSEDILFG